MPTRSSSNARWWMEQRLRPFATTASPRSSRSPEDVRRIEKPDLLEPAHRTAIAVGRKHEAPETALMHAHAHLPRRVPALDRLVERDRLALVERPNQLPERDHDGPRGRIVRDHVTRIRHLVAARACSEEVEERNLKLVCRPKGPVLKVVDGTGAIRIDKALRGDLVVVGRLVRRHDRESGRPALRRGSIDALLIVQERDAPAAEVEALLEPALVRNVVAELRRQHFKGGPAG